MKLIEMTDFVSNYTETGCLLKEINKIRNYAKFLKQPLKLEMFVPCDEENEPLDAFIHNINLTTMSEEWNKAKEKVLFKGFENFEFKVYDKYIKITDKESLNSECFSTVEHLIDNHLIRDIYLTESAIKQIGL